MTRRGRIDIAIVGGGVVGATCALALSRLDLEVVLIEAGEPEAWTSAVPDLRVYAFAPDNAGLLDDLGAWRSVCEARVQPYRRMRVWDAADDGELVFDADAFGQRELGWIVEHGLLVDRLWMALRDSPVALRCPARVEALEQREGEVELRLDDGTRLNARLAIAADGADSTLRRLAGLEIQRRDYAQSGVVAYVNTEAPHEETAWQRFLPGGPLAFLPCADGSSSIVWTLPDDEARGILAMDDATFSRTLTRAFGARLGEAGPQSKRIAFPLRRQLADEYLAGRVLVIGDAAHVVHPLAGQGVNLGLRDVAALRDLVVEAQRRNAAWDAPQRLARWARVRKSENALAAHAFDGINRLFSNDDVAATLLRGPLLGLAGRMPPLAASLWRRAAGLH